MIHINILCISFLYEFITTYHILSVLMHDESCCLIDSLLLLLIKKNKKVCFFNSAYDNFVAVVANIDVDNNVNLDKCERGANAYPYIMKNKYSLVITVHNFENV